MKIILVCLSMVISLTFSFGQEWVNYTVGHYIKEVLADGNYIWVAANDGGLIKYTIPTGTSTFFNKANSELPSNYVNGLAKASDGSIYVATKDGIVRIKPNNEWTVWKSGEHGLGNDFYIYDLIVDAEQNVWAGINNEGLYKLNGDTWEAFSVNGISPQTPASLAIGADSSLWVGCLTCGLWKLKNGNWTTYYSQNSDLPSNVVREVKTIGSSVWVAAGNGIARLQGDTWKIYDENSTGLPINEGWCILPYSADQAWAGVSPGIFNAGSTLLNINGDSVTAFNQNNSGFGNAIIQSLTTTITGKLWGGSWGKGIFQFDGQNPVYHSMSNCGLPSDTVYAVAVDADNNKWFGTAEGLVKFDGQYWTVFGEIIPGLGVPTIKDLEFAPDGTLWAATSIGLAHYDGTAFELFNGNNSPLPSSHIADLTIAATGTIWIRTLNSYLVRLEGTEWTVFSSPYAGFPTFTAMTADQDGNLWAGLYNQIDGTFYFYIGRFDGTDWTVYEKARESGWGHSGTGYVTCLAFNEEGKLHIGTYEDGLITYDGNSWETYEYQHFREPVALKFDKGRNLIWAISFDRGLVSFDGTDWERYYEDNSPISAWNLLSLDIDHTGSIWIGNNLMGVDVFTPPGWTAVEEEKLVETVSHLSPNPFVATTSIDYSLRSKAYVEATLFDIGSKKLTTLETGTKSPGDYSISVDGSEIPSGLYFLEMRIGASRQVFKLVKI